jgi:prolyl oligopeptidase
MIGSEATHETVVEVQHGELVPDPYRWLEDRNHPSTQAWVHDQQRLHDDYFSRLTSLNAIRTLVREYLCAEFIDQPAQVGNTLFFRRRSRDQEQPCIWTRESKTGVERVLVDPSAGGPYTAVAIHRISEDGRLLAYTLRRGGERSAEIHFVDVASGRVLDDFLQAGYERGVMFAQDAGGFYYCHDFVGIATQSQPHEIRYHRFGENTDRDDLLFSAPRTPNSRLCLISDGVRSGAMLYRDGDTGPEIDFYLAPSGGSAGWKHFFANRSVPFAPFFYKGRVYALSFASHPDGQVIELREDVGEGSVIIPPWKAAINRLHHTPRGFYVSYEIEGRQVIHRWTSNGLFGVALPEHPEGTLTMLPTYTTNCSALFFSLESFSQPPSILEYHEPTNSYSRFPVQEQRNDSRAFHAGRVAYQSFDGISIPMWLVSLNSQRESKHRPTILTGYGGFGISMKPRSSVLVAVMLRLGCVFALPNIRGGSEGGLGWHEAGRRRNRQVAFEDFLAAAEWLYTTGITKPGRLAIFGGSNSGLLVGAAMTQRPTLFGAVLCIAPLLDMLRYEVFDDAVKWREEYGTISNQEDFRALHAYSPYHRIEEGVNYPATHFVTGDKDAQCNPAHVRKMAARLQGRPTQANPILVDYSAERGHNGCLPLSVRIEALTRRIAFLCNELGIRDLSGAI